MNRLTLYIKGKDGRCLRTMDKVRGLCDEVLKSRFEIEVVDLKDSPHLARQLNIFMIPTLVDNTRKPAQRFMGSLENTDRLRQFLNNMAASA